MINLYQGKAITTKADIWVGTKHKHTHVPPNLFLSLTDSQPNAHVPIFSLPLSQSLSHTCIHKLESWFGQTDTAGTYAKPVSSINKGSQGSALQQSFKSWHCFKVGALLMFFASAYKISCSVWERSDVKMVKVVLWSKLHCVHVQGSDFTISQQVPVDHINRCWVLFDWFVYYCIGIWCGCVNKSFTPYRSKSNNQL